MSLNRVMLIGRVTHDPELRYTSQGTAVCTFSVATNRVWTDDTGQRQEEAEFTRCVSWRKLAEICSQVLHRGRQVYVDGRLKTQEWEGQDGVKRRTTEMVVNNMIALGPPGSRVAGGPSDDKEPADQPAEPTDQSATKTKAKSGGKKGKKKAKKTGGDEEVPPEEIPF